MFSLAVPILAVLVGATPAPTLTVAPSALADTLSLALQKELGGAAVVHKGADAVARLTRVPTALRLEVRGADGQLMLRRQISLNEQGERPAIRIAVLLLVEVYERLQRGRARVSPPPPAAPPPVPVPAPTAPPPTVAPTADVAPPPSTPPVEPAKPSIEAQPAPPPVSVVTSTASSSVAEAVSPPVAPPAATQTTTVAPPPAPSPLAPRTAAPAAPSPRLWLSGRASVGWWARPGTALLGLQVAAHYDVDRLSAGLRVGVGGLCCHLALSQSDDPDQTRVEASPTQIRGLAEARWRALTVGRLGLSPVVGFGLEWTQVRATATAFIGEPVQETRHAVAGLLRAGGVAHVVLSPRLEIEVGAGVQLRSPRLVVRLPAPFASDSGDLDPGLLSPWLEVGVRFGAF